MLLSLKSCLTQIHPSVDNTTKWVVVSISLKYIIACCSSSCGKCDWLAGRWRQVNFMLKNSFFQKVLRRHARVLQECPSFFDSNRAMTTHTMATPKIPGAPPGKSSSPKYSPGIQGWDLSWLELLEWLEEGQSLSNQDKSQPCIPGEYLGLVLLDGGAAGIFGVALLSHTYSLLLLLKITFNTVQKLWEHSRI